MKNLIFGVLLAGVTAFGLGQDSKPPRNISLLEVEETPLANSEYLKEVKSYSTPVRVTELQEMASNWDVSQAKEFDGRYRPFQAIFRTKQSSLFATYDNNGSILSTEERYVNVSLSNNLRRTIIKRFPGWLIEKTIYTVTYNKRKEAIMRYRIKISKDGRHIWLRTDREGNPK